MAEKIKIIWDFKGTVAEKTAEHHQIHLNEYIANNNINPAETGATHLSELHSIAFVIIERKDMITLRDALKPHRAVLA